MPERIGEYSFTTDSNVKDLHGLHGSFRCIEPSATNHGPVRVRNRFHFGYADGTPFFHLGTTLYAWFYRPSQIRSQTLASLERYSFNKVRMLVFPKKLIHCAEVDLSYHPEVYPFEGTPKHFDFQRFNPEYFRRYEECLRQLRDRNIEADVILFHFYDFGEWDIDRMTDEEALTFLQYFVARVSAFRNVWWCLANEYDLVVDPESFKVSSIRNRRNWDLLGNYVRGKDPYDHLRSIHNCFALYPDRAWITHIGYQHPNTYSLLMDLKREYGKPIVNDEYQYEGNLPSDWGNSSPETVVLSHWLSVMAGGYATHGECYKIGGNKRDIFWTYGGKITGESPARLRFLREVVETVPYQEMTPDTRLGDGFSKFCLRSGRHAYLFFLTEECRKRNITVGFGLPDSLRYSLNIYDVWNCELKAQTVVNPGRIELDVSGWIVACLIRKN